ncbi:unnamed protein product (macronuclear) [Paramecium tetraurelia]|uniref:Uncharacterized protein n=1 Tax=Paramecium tetraurelia TaxID=5888 RepID=A0DJB0_PARTE|nr:uncharacterized protein GSPATT00017471001 [Paramecium tetraurelia]CAK83127.1 unnamed protein product [Paramecium tetraurelia]|eukprot:XP_001450524.1 hypothetical protein (macronuclear) [Paramecium tetraurelia strain d4-2]
MANIKLLVRVRFNVFKQCQNQLISYDGIKQLLDFKIFKGNSKRSFVECQQHVTKQNSDSCTIDDQQDNQSNRQQYGRKHPNFQQINAQKYDTIRDVSGKTVIANISTSLLWRITS